MSLFVWNLAKTIFCQVRWPVHFVTWKRKTRFYQYVDCFCLFVSPLTFNRLKVTILNRSSWNFTNWWSSWSDRILFIFEVKRSSKAQGQQLSQISKILNFHLIDLKFEDHLHIRLLNSPKYYFEVNVRHISKIVNFQSIDLKFEEHFNIRSLNSSITCYYWGHHWPHF